MERVSGELFLHGAECDEGLIKTCIVEMLLNAGAALAVAGFVAGVPAQHVAVARTVVKIHVDEVIVETRDERFVEPRGGGDLVPHRAVALAEAVEVAREGRVGASDAREEFGRGTRVVGHIDRRARDA